MKLSQLESSNTAVKALRANFGLDFDTSKLDRVATKQMMFKVKGLMKEAKESPEFYKNQTSPTYMKLVFMAQALVEHYNTFKSPRIIFENEEVEKSQVILAAQDMVDSVQKMIEEVNDMLVKELPALTDSIQSEIGANESAAFNQSASQALTTLNQTLSQSKSGLQDALNSLTGLGGGFDMAPPAAGGDEMAVTDIATATSPSGTEVAGAETAVDLPPEEPEAAPVGGVGRAKR